MIMINYPDLTDQELMSKAVTEDKEAFQELILRSEDRVKGWILSFTKQSYLVEEIFQISCIKAWRHIAKFRMESKFSTWMCNIARNAFYDHYRAKKRRPELSLDEIMSQQRERGGVFELHCLGSVDHPRNKHQDSDYRLKEIERALEKNLDDVHRKPLMLFVNDGLGYSEIAKKLNCPVGTVMSRIFYGRKKAQKILKKIRDELVAE